MKSSSMAVVCSLKELSHLTKEKTAQVDKASEPHIKLAPLKKLMFFAFVCSAAVSLLFD